MIYEYFCPKCERDYDIVKSIDEYNSQEFCSCGEEMQKLFRPQMIIVDKTKPEYYHSLGQVVRNKNHRNELIKKYNLTEVGNENPHKIYEQIEQTKIKKFAKRYEDAMKDI